MIQIFLPTVKKNLGRKKRSSAESKQGLTKSIFKEFMDAKSHDKTGKPDKDHHDARDDVLLPIATKH